MVHEKLQDFNAICRTLIEKSIRFGMRYPATLTLTRDESEDKFNTLKTTQDFINTLD